MSSSLRRMARHTALLAGLASCATAKAAPPAEVQVHTAALAWLKDQVVAQRIDGARVDATVLPLPARRIAPACDAPLEIRPKTAEPRARMVFVTRCPGQTRDTPYSVQMSIVTKIVTAAGPIAPNQPLSRDDVVLSDGDLLKIKGSLTDPADAIGKTSRLALKTGQAIQANALRSEPISRKSKSAKVVTRGQSVRIVARGEGIQVDAAGTAMQNGAIGDEIRVRNRSGKEIGARVTGPAEVEPIGSNP
jgi:flagellar basal body P-ring formation protein FlgA